MRIQTIPVWLVACCLLVGCAMPFSRNPKNATSSTLDAGADQAIAVAQLLRTARAHEADEQYDKAIADYKQALSLLKDHPVALHRLAVVLDQHGEPAVAHEYFRQAIAAAPKNADLFCDYGYSCYLQDRNDEALAAYQHARKLQPRSQRVHMNMALLQTKMGDEDVALAHFRKAGCKDDVARVNVAHVYMWQDQWEAAETVLHAGLRLTPDSVNVKNALANLDRIRPVSAPVAMTRPRESSATKNQIAPSGRPRTRQLAQAQKRETPQHTGPHATQSAPQLGLTETAPPEVSSQNVVNNAASAVFTPTATLAQEVHAPQQTADLRRGRSIDETESVSYESSPMIGNQLNPRPNLAPTADVRIATVPAQSPRTGATSSHTIATPTTPATATKTTAAVKTWSPTLESDNRSPGSDTANSVPVMETVVNPERVSATRPNRNSQHRIVRMATRPIRPISQTNTR